MPEQGAVIRWDEQKGYGFIRSPKSAQDIFFHVRDLGFSSAELRPDLPVSFEVIHIGGKGPRAMQVQRASVARTAAPTQRRPPPRQPQSQPQPQAAPAPRPLDSGSTRRSGAPAATPARSAGLMLLLIATYALLLLVLCWRGRLPVVLLPASLALNLLLFWIYWQDKHAARNGAWRTEEKTLHTLALLGGWPAAWLAQRVLRHKSSKPRFQQAYWMTVLCHWTLLLGWLWVSRYSTPQQPWLPGA